VTARSDFESVDGGPRSFRVSVPVRRGDRLGLELSPGSAAGFRPGKATTRFVGPLGAEPRRPEPRGPAEALRLRVDLTPGAAVQPELVTGAAAAGAPDGRRLEERELAVAGGTTVTATVVVLPGGVAVDVFRSATRQARISVPRADPAGRPVSFTAKGAADLTLAWRNPDGTLVETPYRVTATSIAAL
jgi:hypothetical protein